MAPPSGYQLVWSDEFNGSTLDTSKWRISYGRVSLSNSILTLGPDSGEIDTRKSTNKFRFRFGYVETRIRFAFDPQNPTVFRRTHRTGPWLGNAPTANDYWGGELDVTETGSGPNDMSTSSYCGGNKINTTVHRFLKTDPYVGQYTNRNKRYPASFNLSSDFHVLGFEWTSDFIRTLLDGTEILRTTNSETPIPDTHLSPIIGLCPRCWPLYGPDNPYTSPCPSDVPTGREIAQVDYIRIYQLGACPTPAIQFTM